MIGCRASRGLARCSAAADQPRIATRAVTAPAAEPPTKEQVHALASFVSQSKQLLILTGAGISTESHIPDYRSPGGAYASGYKPMTHQEFIGADASRRRYWARSFAGWEKFAERTRPNAAHFAVARLQTAGRVTHLLTQNVDRLHQAAGSKDVIEMHGTTHRVVCLACRRESCRFEMQSVLKDLNPDFHTARAVSTMVQARPSVEASELASEPQTRPDGDTTLLPDAYSGFRVPPCACGGILKPDVVFFGDNMEKDIAAATKHAAASADALLVIGSSLQVYSAFRIAKAVADAGKPLAILSVGPTRADNLATLKVEALAGEALPRVVADGGLDLPQGLA